LQVDVERERASRLDAEAGLAPVTSLGVVTVCRTLCQRTVAASSFRDAGRHDVPDGVTGPQTDPLGDGAVLLLSFGKLDLGAERLLGL
jgi:hypothetical protein